MGEVSPCKGREVLQILPGDLGAALLRNVDLLPSHCSKPCRRCLGQPRGQEPLKMGLLQAGRMGKSSPHWVPRQQEWQKSVCS